MKESINRAFSSSPRSGNTRYSSLLELLMILMTVTFLISLTCSFYLLSNQNNFQSPIKKSTIELASSSQSDSSQGGMMDFIGNKQMIE